MSRDPPNRYDRFVIAPGLLGWEYAYANTAFMGTRDGMASGLEIDVQLAGDWSHRGARSGARVYTPGTICTISPTESYSTSFRAEGSPGLQVGFIVMHEEDEKLGGIDGALAIANGRHIEDTRFVSFCRDLHGAFARGAPLGSEVVANELRGFVKRHAEIVPFDPLLRAKRELDRYFAQPLYLQDIADLAGVHRATFGRKFAVRFGLTPARYRVLLRLNEAARLTWSRVDLGIPEIARRVGFEDLAYFHRAFRAHFGTTPAAYAAKERVGA